MSDPRNELARTTYQKRYIIILLFYKITLTLSLVQEQNTVGNFKKRIVSI
jgi:hypothetical protein